MKLFYPSKFNIYLRKYIFISVSWSLLVGASLFWNLYQVHENTLLTATAAAQASINKDIIFRKWATSHGGVYVPPTKNTPPNPYLKIADRDVVTTNGKVLTLINPAYMLRELQSQFGSEYGNLSHLTSLKPLNPHNLADAWETKALQGFERGHKEMLEVQQIKKQSYLRLMRPFIVEQGCLKCHAVQGYKVGDIRGGISIAISLTSYLAQEQKQNRNLTYSHGLIWLIGLIAQNFTYRREYRLNNKRKQAEAKLRLSERRASSLLEITLRASSLNETELLQATLEQAEKLTDSQISYVHFVNEDQETLTLGVWSSSTLQTCNAIYNAHYPISKAGIWADCFRQKQALICNDYKAMTTKKGLPEGHISLSRLISVPVMEADKVRMILGVGNKATDYDKGDLRELELIAASLWSLIERKRMEIELQQYWQHLEELVKIRTAELLKAKQAAEAANIAKSMFLATMSHELRTPLNAILGFSELMSLEKNISPKSKSTLDIINRSGTHLLSIINNILELSKIEAGRLELENQSFDLIVLLQDIAKMIEGRATQNQLLFKLELAANLQRYIKTDITKLRQIIINLLGNAVKFTKQGSVTLNARSVPLQNEEKVRLHIDVIDTGMGIPADKVSEMFQPFVQFVQADSALQGTGLGLVISKSLLELMGGTISVQSTLGVGSVFSIDLPVLIAEECNLIANEDLPIVEGIAIDQPSWRLLVVDDNPDNRLLLARLLVPLGFQVREAENGKEAVTAFEQWQPHLIWMDMRMPIMDGYEATAKIRQLPGGKEVKILALTASAFKEQHNSIIEVGCDAVIHKPFHSPEIFTALIQYLGVKFIYREVLERVSMPILEITAEILTNLPLELRQQLHQAALNLDVEETEIIIAKIRATDPNIAAGLQKLSEHYQFEEIIQLTEVAINQQP